MKNQNGEFNGTVLYEKIIPLQYTASQQLKSDIHFASQYNSSHSKLSNVYVDGYFK